MWKLGARPNISLRYFRKIKYGESYENRWIHFIDMYKSKNISKYRWIFKRNKRYAKSHWFVHLYKKQIKFFRIHGGVYTRVT